MPTEIETLLNKMDIGFDKLYAKFENLHQDFNNHKIPCVEKFASVDKQLGIIAAVDCVEDEQKEKERDWGKWIIRLLLGLLAAGTIGLYFK